MNLASTVGYLAAAASTSSFAPQAWKIIRTRETKDISTGMYVLTVVGFSLWTAYGVLLLQWPLILTNGICLALSAFIFALKLLHTVFEVSSFLCDLQCYMSLCGVVPLESHPHKKVPRTTVAAAANRDVRLMFCITIAS